MLNVHWTGPQSTVSSKPIIMQSTEYIRAEKVNCWLSFCLFHSNLAMRKDCWRHSYVCPITLLRENRRCWLVRADVILFCRLCLTPGVRLYAGLECCNSLSILPLFLLRQIHTVANYCIPAHGERQRDSFILCLSRGEKFPAAYQHCK